MKPNFLFLAALAYVAVAVPIGNVRDVVDIEARGKPYAKPEYVGATGPKASPKGHPTQVTSDIPRPASYGSPEKIKRREFDDDIEARGPPKKTGYEDVGASAPKTPKGHPTQVTSDHPRPAFHGLPEKIKSREIDWDA